MANPFEDTVDEAYNPFQGDTEAAPVQTSYTSAPAEPAYDAQPPTFDPPSTAAKPKPSRGGFGGTVTSTLANATGSSYVDPVTGMPITEKQIIDRERQLADRERAIADKEQQLASGNLVRPTTRKNFPPLLKWWAYHPDEDLPEGCRKIAKVLFWIFLATGIVYFVNLIGCFACLGAKGAARTSVGMLIGLGCAFFLVFWPLSFEVCYFVLYNSFISGKALRFFCGMAMFFIWFAILVFNVIGIKDGGSVGFIIMINLFQGDGEKSPKQPGMGVIGVIFVILGCADLVAMGWQFVMLWRYYKQQGLGKKAFAEVGQFAAEKAAENPELVADVARNTYG